MTKPASDSSFTADVAAFYESTLVPLIFLPYADDLAARVRALEPSRVLEVACGTGVLTRALGRALPDSVSIVATDLNDAMIEHARRVGTPHDVTWRQADAMSLPFEDGSFDAVVCQFSVMFFPDRAAAYREIRRVLGPGGTFVFSVWNDIARNEFADVVTRAVGELYPDDPPVFLARTPHGHGSRAEIDADLTAAGFSRRTFVEREDVSPAASARSAALAYCQGTPLRNEILARDPDGLERATAHAAEAIRSRFGDGPIEGRISATIVTAG